MINLFFGWIAGVLLFFHFHLGVLYTFCRFFYSISLFELNHLFFILNFLSVVYCFCCYVFGVSVFWEFFFIFSMKRIFPLKRKRKLIKSKPTKGSPIKERGIQNSFRECEDIKFSNVYIEQILIGRQIVVGKKKKKPY